MRCRGEEDVDMLDPQLNLGWAHIAWSPFGVLRRTHKPPVSLESRGKSWLANSCRLRISPFLVLGYFVKFLLTPWRRR